MFNCLLTGLCYPLHDACTFLLSVGTLRPDLIESASELASGSADVIKTHHNDTDLVRQLRQQVNACITAAWCQVISTWPLIGYGCVRNMHSKQCLM